MPDKQFLGYISVALLVVGYSSYFWAIFRGQTKPHLFSWIVWGTVSGVAAYAQIVKQGGPGAWAATASAAVCFLIAIAAFFRGEKSITRGDWICLISAFAAIPLWLATHEPLWSVILVVAVDFLGFYPTVRKSFLRPYEESPIMYSIDAVKFVISIFALETYSVTAVLYPIVATMLNGGLVTMILWRRAALNKLVN